MPLVVEIDARTPLTRFCCRYRFTDHLVGRVYTCPCRRREEDMRFLMRRCMSAITIIHELISYLSYEKVTHPQANIFAFWMFGIIISLYEDVISWPQEHTVSSLSRFEAVITTYWVITIYLGRIIGRIRCYLGIIRRLVGANMMWWICIDWGESTISPWVKNVLDVAKVNQMVWISLKTCNILASRLCIMRVCYLVYCEIKDLVRHSLSGLHARQMIFHNRSSSFNQRLAKTWIILRYLGITIPVIYTVIPFFFCQKFLLPNELVIAPSVQILVITSKDEMKQRSTGKPISNVFWFEFLTYVCWMVNFAIYQTFSPETQNSIAADKIEAFQRFSWVLELLQGVVFVSLTALNFKRS